MRGLERRESLFVDGKACRLHVRCAGASRARAFVAAEPEPLEIVEDALRRAGDDARRIEVLHADDECRARIVREIA